MAHKRKGGRSGRLGRASRGGGPSVEGVLRVVRPGSATVETAEGTFAVARGGLREGMNGDTVGVTLVRRGHGDPEAYVQTVARRATTAFLGTYGTVPPLGVVVPLDGRIRHDFFVSPQDESPSRLGVAEGDVVSARILAYPSRREAGIVTIERRVGSAAELDVDVEAVVASYGLATSFPDAALSQALPIRADVDRALAADGLRRDLRGEMALTVDPVDARDFDDAVSAHRLPDGGYEVGVHIADVTHYVPWDSPIDVEARARTCSVYLVDRVLPMLPERLSNDVCSLRPGEDRLCMSVVMRLSASGEVESAEAFPSAIRSRARLDYDSVDRLLAGESSPADLPCDASVAPLAGETLRVLHEVADKRILVRARRGAIDFDSVEARVTLDPDGRPTGVSVRRKTPATSLIEEAMLIANESVATILATHDVAAAFRVHESPSPDTLATTLPILRELGLVRGEGSERLVSGDPFATQDVLREAEGTPSRYLVSSLLLRAQKRAIYLPSNQGHYALGAKAYCHFTSPIRRYPDVVAHRALKAYLRDGLRSREQHETQRLLPQICRDCSDRERTADAASRASQRVKMAELFALHVGESFSGVVTGCERFGIFVTLDDTCAEGLVPVRALGEEWYEYDEARLSLTGEATGRTWRLGQRVAVTVTRTSPARGQIDFALATGAADRPAGGLH